jgi:hypothetical protein
MSWLAFLRVAVLDLRRAIVERAEKLIVATCRDGCKWR